MSSEYVFDQAHRFYTRPDRAEFSYTDSNEVEDRLWRIVSSSRDRSTASKELIAGITDWPSLYHLSPYRANLLRPFEALIRGAVLEVGSGCGALTRFLGEQSASIVGIEGSTRRAAIAAERCADLPNVQLYCDNFQDFPIEQEFQLVTCIGVIEYSPMYFTGRDPLDLMLRRLASCVAPDGYVLIAIENRLGLKYFAGAPEDHTGKPFQSIEDLYSSSTPVTLGKREWQERLREAGLDLVSFWYPFPDYKIPRLVVSSAAFQERWLNLGSLLRSCRAPDRGFSYQRIFSEAMVWPVLVKNGLAEDMANSFVILARRPGTGGPAWTAPDLLYHYSADRLPEYGVEMSIRGSEEDSWVRRRRLFATEPPASASRHRLMDERYIPGELYADGLYRLLNSAGWKLEDLARWAEPWVEYLRTSTYVSGNGPALLPAEFLDCIPSNLVRRADGALMAFDLEWVAEEAPPLSYVVFRGLWASLMSSGTCAKPAGLLQTRVVEVAFAVMHLLGFQVSSDEQEMMIRQEARLQETVRGIPLEQEILNVRLPSLEFRDWGNGAGPRARRPLELQLFWTRALGLNFTETDSCRVRTPASNLRQTVSIKTPVGLPSTALLRIDLSNRPGLARLFGMRLLGAGGKTIWEWDGVSATLRAAAQQNMEILAVPDSTTVLVHFLSDDPMLILPIPEAVLGSFGLGGVLEIDFSWIGTVVPADPGDEEFPNPISEHVSETPPVPVEPTVQDRASGFRFQRGALSADSLDGSVDAQAAKVPCHGRVSMDPAPDAVRVLTSPPDPDAERRFVELHLGGPGVQRNDCDPSGRSPNTWRAVTRDPWIVRPVGLCGAEYRFFVLVMSCSCEAQQPCGQLFWGGPDRPGFSERLSLQFPVLPDGNLHTYILDLHAGADPGVLNYLWWHRGMLDAVRLDPLDAPGEFTITLAGFAHQDLAGSVRVRDALSLLPLRTELSYRYLRGSGIEIGALQNPLELREDTHIRYADRLTVAEARSHYAELEQMTLVTPAIICDAAALSPIADGSVDFVIANHVLEHLADPLAALREWLRVVRPGGHLYVAVPDHVNPLDRLRPITPLDHLVADFEERRQSQHLDRAHFAESVASTRPELTPQQRAAAEAELVSQNYAIHFHTFSRDTFAELMEHAAGRFSADLTECCRGSDGDAIEYIAILRKS